MLIPLSAALTRDEQIDLFRFFAAAPVMNGDAFVRRCGFADV